MVTRWIGIEPAAFFELLHGFFENRVGMSRSVFDRGRFWSNIQFAFEIEYHLTFWLDQHTFVPYNDALASFTPQTQRSEGIIQIWNVLLQNCNRTTNAAHRNALIDQPQDRAHAYEITKVEVGSHATPDAIATWGRFRVGMGKCRTLPMTQSFGRNLQDIGGVVQAVGAHALLEYIGRFPVNRKTCEQVLVLHAESARSSSIPNIVLSNLVHQDSVGFEEAFLRLVPGPDFKSGGGCGDTSPAGSIPVRFRQ